jgi:flagellar biosynthetic protein FliQ
MSENLIMGVLKDAISTGLTVVAPILVVGLVVGLLISIFQATTQIQEQTLTFVPKLIAVALIGLLTGSWMLHKVVDFTTRIFNLMANVTR